VLKNFTVTPQPRITDDHPFVTLNIQEAETLTGDRALIDTQAWTDATPSTVSATDIETTEAQYEDGYYWFQWVDDVGVETQWWGPVRSADHSQAAFATTDDLLARLGKTEFTDLEAAQAAQFLESATANIVVAVDKTDEWAAELSPVPSGLKSLCLELAARAMVNPTGVRSQSEQLGSWQRSESYTDDGHNIDLTASETLRARRIVYGSNSGSAQAESTMDDIAETVLSPTLP